MKAEVKRVHAAWGLTLRAAGAFLDNHVRVGVSTFIRNSSHSQTLRATNNNKVSQAAKCKDRRMFCYGKVLGEITVCTRGMNFLKDIYVRVKLASVMLRSDPTRCLLAYF